ncbi:MAG: DUF1156 domain-containing protein [Planctomycetaceae bacterium]|nr:DUF1156 domain-containing protein [Planctomycetaceae bacterium]
MKRLIETDLPIKKISVHARREKSIRHGHISTLHIWWARRPLAACRAVICAALWLDPVEKNCPQLFRNKAAEIITNFAQKVDGDLDLLELCDVENRKRWESLAKRNETLNVKTEKGALLLRQYLLDFIADFANWDCSTVPVFLETARALTLAAHEAMGGLPETKPLVVDPFAGGGSIPLEALRVGADAFASDLNPVAVLLNKVVLEYIPKYGQKLADEVRKWGQWIKTEAEKELQQFYPKDSDGATPIAYLWARTIRCEGPGCGAEVPLVRSLWLAKKANRSIGLKMISRNDKTGVDFEIIDEKLNELIKHREWSPDGTVHRGNATCPCCGYTTPVAKVREQLKSRQGGANDAKLMCVVTTRPDQQGRFYRTPNQTDINAVNAAESELKKRIKNHKKELSLVPDEPTPPPNGHRAVSSLSIYGFEHWCDLFSSRQLLSLTTLSRLVNGLTKQIKNDDKDFNEAIQTCLALTVSRGTDLNNTLCGWKPDAECPVHLFARQAIPILWDFGEAVLTSDSSGSWDIMVQRTCDSLLPLASIGVTSGHIAQASATKHLLPNNTSDFFCTDPPYYDAVPYADLSDFFLVWLKRSIPDFFFHELLTPKEEQAIVWHPNSLTEKEEYKRKMQDTMKEGRRITKPNGISVVVFAHKSTSGWEAQLQAMIDAGWIITASWAIDTEMDSRMNARGTASLASSIHLVCRPRVVDVVGNWREVMRELPERIHAWMPRLSSEGVVGADAIFACLGPALEIFSQYTKVEKANGEIVTLREFLEIVWGTISKEALSMIFDGADADSLEEDARLTSIWLWTLSTGTNSATIENIENNENNESDNEPDDNEEPTGTIKPIKGFSLEYDAARKMAQGLGVHLEMLDSIVEVKGSTARLRTVEERAVYLFKKSIDTTDTPPTLSQKEQKKQMTKKQYKKTLFKIDEFIPDDSSSDQAIGVGIVFVPGTTVLDRIHQSMILFGGGRGEVLKRFLVTEGHGKDARFWKLAQSLSALYPITSTEKRLIDGVLARKKGLGL